MRVMLVMPRFAYDLHDFLERKFAGDDDVLVIRDRRVGQRRTRPAMRHVDRRRRDRRGRDRGSVGFLVPIKSLPDELRAQQVAAGSLRDSR